MPIAVSFSAKKARELMARYMIDQRIEKPDGLKDFDVEAMLSIPDYRRTTSGYSLGTQLKNRHKTKRTISVSENNLTPNQQIELEAATFRRLIAHLDERKDVQNIDLMILAGFCRNCLSSGTRPAPTSRVLLWTWTMRVRPFTA